jgi:hypothetical protein
MTDTMIDDDEEKARRHLTVVAYELVRRFGASKAAGLMLGATAGIVQHELKQPPPEWYAEMARAWTVMAAEEFSKRRSSSADS